MPLTARNSLRFWSLMATVVLVLYVISNKKENGASKVGQMLLWKETVSISEREFTSTSREKLKNGKFIHCGEGLLRKFRNGRFPLVR